MIDMLLLGSTNVGKSTLFNLLIENKQALVADIAGLTKDWEEGICVLNQPGGKQACTVRIVDTPGVEYENLSECLSEPWCTFVNQAQLVCLVVDGERGITNFDAKIAHDLRLSNKTYVVLVNKMDKAAARNNFVEFFALAGDKTLSVVAINKQDRFKLSQELVEYFLPSTEQSAKQAEDLRLTDAVSLDKQKIKLVILGKPNSGKSSLVNHLLNYERLKVSPVAGTTHNAVTVDYTWQDQSFSITDTAGVRRRQNIKSGLESVITAQSWRMVRQVAEIVLLLVDSLDGISKQDWVLLDQVLAMYKPVIVCFTKIDLLSAQDRSKMSRTKYIKSFRAAFISSRTGAGIQNMLKQAKLTHQIRLVPIATSHLNRWLQECTSRLSPPYVKGKRLKLKYMLQTRVTVPTFLIFSNDIIPTSYLVYLRGSLCKKFDLWSIPFKIECRTS